jgi:hypothetical protein
VRVQLDLAGHVDDDQVLLRQRVDGFMEEVQIFEQKSFRICEEEKTKKESSTTPKLLDIRRVRFGKLSSRMIFFFISSENGGWLARLFIYSKQ